MKAPHAVARRPGFSLVELIVAMVLLSIALVALAGTTVVAQRTFAGAAADEAAVHAAAAVIDSLLAESAPASGSRLAGRILVEWMATSDSAADTFQVTAHVRDGAVPRLLEFTARRARSSPFP
jgi:prepilin-type N-terminal cleavage/methylation domain-containing protein